MHSWFDWTSWLFGLVSILYIVVAEQRLVRERRRLRRVAGEIEPSAPAQAPATPPRADRQRDRSRIDDRLRSVLIQIAVDALPFSLAVDRSRRFDATRADVEAAARALRASELLRFAEPLGDDTRIRLN